MEGLIVQAAPQEAEDSGKVMDMQWSALFELHFTVPHPLTQAEFEECAKGHLQWMYEDIATKFPKALLVELDKHQMIQRATFRE